MADFKTGKPLLPCNFAHQKHGSWSNLPLVVYRIRTAESNFSRSLGMLLLRVDRTLLSVDLSVSILLFSLLLLVQALLEPSKAGCGERESQEAVVLRKLQGAQSEKRSRSWSSLEKRLL